MSDSSVDDILKLINHCILPKLDKRNEEFEKHPEYEVRLKNLDDKFHHLLSSMSEIKLEDQITVLAFLKILYEELTSDGPWNNDRCKEYANKLNGTFEFLHGVSLQRMFSSTNSFDSQAVFDECLRILHKKIRADNFKHYPSLIEVYCLIVQCSKDYNLTIDAPKILPISLYLIDDYVNNYQIKGLMCLFTSLKCLNQQKFSVGNYYEVIYRSLRNKVSEKDLEVTKLHLDCILLLLKMLPEDVKSTKIDDILSVILEQLYIESNLYRKSLLFKVLKSIIEMYGVNCVKRKKIQQKIFFDNLDICCNDAVAEILLSDVLECLQMWIKHCWCVWRLSTDYRILNLLIKLLYVTSEEYWKKIAYIMIILLNLCSNTDRKQISESLHTSVFNNLKFLDRLELIKKEIV